METKTYYLIALIIWSIPWKGFALWKSARRGDTRWFIGLLLINTAGILDILYLFFFSENKNQKRFPIRNSQDDFDINPY